MINKQIRKIAFKLLGVLLDRRLWLYGLTVVFALLQDDPSVTAVGVLAGAWVLLLAWTARPPSGLDYDKIVYDRTGELARLLRELGIDEG